MKVLKILVILVFLSGCAAKQSSMLGYYDESSVAPDNYGTIAGSRKGMPFPQDDKTAYILAINGVPLKSGKRTYSQAIKVGAGRNRITIAFSQGSIVAQHTYNITFENGSSFVAKARSDGRIIVFWVEDAIENKMVTRRAVVQGATRPSSLIFVPIFIK